MTPASDAPAPSHTEYIDRIRRELRLVRVLGEPVVVNWWLVVSNVLFFVIAWGYGFRLTDGFGLSAKFYQPVQMVFYTGMKVNEPIANGAWWRLVSSVWVHLDMLHLAFNVYGLWVLGPLIEKFYGARRHFIIFLYSGLLAAIASYVFNDVDSGGASGALYGLVGALLVFAYRNRRALPERVASRFTTGLVPWVALSIGIGFFDAIPFDNAAHLGGLFSGMALAMIMRSKLRRPANQPDRSPIVLGATIVGVAIVVITAWFWSLEATTCLGARADYLGCYPELVDPLVNGKLDR